MRYENIYNTSRALPRMSWASINLYNLFSRSLGPASGPDETTFKRTFMTLFQQRWKAKRLVRGYHGDDIGEKKFKKWYLPQLIPDVRPKRPIGLATRSMDALRLGNRTKEAKMLEESIIKADRELASAPVGSLMFIEVEKRIDTIVFRSCLATSVYQARHLVLSGRVKLNGEVCNRPGTRLEPGDMISVDPEAISFLMKPKEATTEAAAIPEESQNEPNPELADATTEQTEPVPESKYRQRVASRSVSSSPTGYELALPDYAAPFIFIPAYLEVSFVTCSAVYVRDPTARKDYSELPSPYDADGELMRLAWEWYARVRPRMRGRLQRQTGPGGTRRPVPYWGEYQKGL